VRVIPDFNIFYGHNANEPSGEKVAWVLQHMRDSGRCPETASLNFALGRRVFRPDIFEKANELSRKVESSEADALRPSRPLREAKEQKTQNEEPTQSHPAHA
jgi:hypothetical protein